MKETLLALTILVTEEKRLMVKAMQKRFLMKNKKTMMQNCIRSVRSDRINMKQVMNRKEQLFLFS